MSEHLQIYRETRNSKGRKARAWYNCKPYTNGMWFVNFSADYVPSESWEYVEDCMLMSRITEHMNIWLKKMKTVDTAQRHVVES